jgi:hypothetical protein
VDLPLATTEASALNSTTLIFARWADILRIVFPVVTSQRKTDRSPPEETNLVLSCALEKHKRNKMNGRKRDARGGGDQNRDENLHRDRENLVTVGRIGLDHCAQVGVPETDKPVLTTREDIFRASFGIPCDMHGALVILESGVECTRERLRTSGRCHRCKVPLRCFIVVACLALACPAPFGPKLLISHITLHRRQWPRDRSLRLTSPQQSVRTYQHPRRRLLFLPRGPTASKAYMTSSSSTYSHSSPTQTSVRSTRPTATWHDCPSTTRYIVHSYQKFYVGFGLNIRGCLLVAVEEPLLARVWQAPLEGFEGFHRP